jgi:hypothetical protein
MHSFVLLLFAYDIHVRIDNINEILGSRYVFKAFVKTGPYEYTSLEAYNDLYRFLCDYSDTLRALEQRVLLEQQACSAIYTCDGLYCL